MYILDEAHMLSTAAWNAFLKTLEEPPPNTVFVLATTEAQKVPATVVDRCHRFDFHRPTVEQIASVVRRTAQAESIEIPPEAVAALARSATGSFRDALGTLEQLVTYSGQEIALADVLAVLGVADARLLTRPSTRSRPATRARALQALEECAEQGRDAGSFARDLEVRARELLVVQTLGEVPDELSLTPEADARAARAGRARGPRDGRAPARAARRRRWRRCARARTPRTRLELALVKAGRAARWTARPRALLARIERLEAARRRDATRRTPAPRHAPRGRPPRETAGGAVAGDGRRSRAAARRSLRRSGRRRRPGRRARRGAPPAPSRRRSAGPRRAVGVRCGRRWWSWCAARTR